MKPLAEKKKTSAPRAIAEKAVSAPSRKRQKKTAAGAKAHPTNGAKPALHENHPLAPVFGAFNDEPLWAEFEEILKRNREADRRNFKE